MNFILMIFQNHHGESYCLPWWFQTIPVVVQRDDHGNFCIKPAYMQILYEFLRNIYSFIHPDFAKSKRLWSIKKAFSFQNERGKSVYIFFDNV
ncbi:hypothetical protein DXA74_07630 [Bacteroides sp. OF04-15BH]|nr:hypothetical protein DXA74_07630 [Bacteroides sp. OF04-15BH]